MDLTVKEAAAYLRVSPDTVRHWADGGLLKGYRLPIGHRRFREHDVANFRQVLFGDGADTGGNRSVSGE